MEKNEIIDRKIERIKTQMLHAEVDLEFAEKMDYDTAKYKDRISEYKAEIETLKGMKE